MGCGSSKGEKDKPKAPSANSNSLATAGSEAPQYPDDEFLKSLPDRLKDVPELDDEDKKRLEALDQEIEAAWAKLSGDDAVSGENLEKLVRWLLEQFNSVVSSEQVRAEIETMLHNTVKNHMDKDRDGKVEKHEFAEYYKKLAPAMIRVQKKTVQLLAASEASRTERESAQLDQTEMETPAEETPAEEIPAEEIPAEEKRMTEREWLAEELPEYNPDTAPELTDEEAADLYCHTARCKRKYQRLAEDTNAELSGDALLELIQFSWKLNHLSANPTTLELQAEMIKAMQRADQNANGALDWDEFRSYFESTAVAYTRFKKQQAQSA